MAEAEYKLIYFNTQGLGEPARYIFAIAGVKYEDVRLPVDEYWPRLRPEVKTQFPWGTVPVLKYKDMELGQSGAIYRFLGRKFDLAGDNELEAAKCDEIGDSLKDFTGEWLKHFYETDPKKKGELQATLVTEVFPCWLKKYDEVLAQKGSNNTFIVGSRLSWADVVLAHTLTNFAFGNRVDYSHLNGYPHLKRAVEEFFELPAVKKWVKERPITHNLS